MRMPKKQVYVESSVISYLTARPSNDILKLAKQRQTQMWWEQREKWELFVSQIVVREIRDGNPDASRKRLAAVRGLPSLPETDEVRQLAAHLVAAGAIPEKAREDARHIATAALHGMDYLVTWNQTHISNPDMLEKVYSAIREAGYTPPVLVRPDSLLEMKHGI